MAAVIERGGRLMWIWPALLLLIPLAGAGAVALRLALAPLPLPEGFGASAAQGSTAAPTEGYELFAGTMALTLQPRP